MKKTAIVILVILVTVILGACTFSITSANYSSLQTASEVDSYNKPVTVTKTFSTDAPVIYATGTVNNAPEGTVIEAMWVYNESDPAIDIDSASLVLEDTTIDFSFSLARPNNGWPAGEYEVRLSIDGEYKESLYFTVN